MPKYSINGHTYESPTELSDDEIDEIGGWDSQPDEKNLWEKANTPFTNKVSGMGKSLGKWIDPEQGGDWRDPRTALGAFAESVGNTVENMFFTPAGLATAVAFPGATALGKAAINPALKAAPMAARALSTTAKGLHTGGRVASAAYAAEGAKSAAEGVSEGDIGKIIQGGLGAYLGQKGARYGYTAPTPPRRPPPLGPPGLGYVPEPAQRSYPPGLGTAPPIRQPQAPNIPPPNMPPAGPVAGPPGFGRPIGQPNIPPPNAPSPVTNDIAETIRKISQGQRTPAPPIEAPLPPVEDPFTPVPEPPPFDPRDPQVMGQEIPYEPPPSGEVGPPATPALPPEITTPNMVPQRPILDRTLTQDVQSNPLAELAKRRSGREGKAPRTKHAEPPMGVEEPVVPEQVPEPPAEKGPQYVVYDSEGGVRPLYGTGADTYVARPGETYGVEGPEGFQPIDDKGGKYFDEPVAPPAPVEPTPVQQFADQVVPPTQAETVNQAMAPPVMPPATTAPAGKKGGLRPRQKFQTQTFAPGPPRQAPEAPVPPPVAPPPAPVVPPKATSGRLVRTKSGGFATEPIPAPVEAPKLEHIVATNADQVTQYLGEGYKVVSRTADGNIVMERPAAPEAPAKPPVKQKSLAAEIEEGQARSRAEYEARRKSNNAKWGATRAKAKELGVDLGKERDIKAAEKMIQSKDPNWTTPEVAGGGQEPSSASERMPKKKESFRPGGVRHGKRFDPAPEPDTGVRKWWNEARGLMSVDFPFMTSAAFRQGLPFIGTKYWKSAFGRAAKAYKSQEAFNQVQTSIEIDPLYQPQFDPSKVNAKMELSIGERLGLKFLKPGEIGGAEGVTRGPITSKLWYTSASDRSFAAFTNHLRAWTFKRLLKDAGIWNEATKQITNEPLAREIADFVNTASGRGKLEFGYGMKKGQKYNLEQSARTLTDAFFSPRLMFSRMKMMNPATYLQADPFVRKQYTNAMIRTIGSWWLMASLAEWGGKLSGIKVIVSKDPNNADFGKIKIGNTRIDPGGGFQQFLVMTHRLMPNIGKHRPAGTPVAAIDLAIGLLSSGGGTTTSSVTGNKSILGRGYKAETRGDILERFIVSKAHPSAKLIYDAAHASEKYPVYLGDRLLQMALPMMVPDVIEALQNDPEMAPAIFLASNLGMGSQTYEGGRVEKPAIMPKALQKYDIAIGGK